MLERGLIVSCQAAEGETLYGKDIMKHFAYAATAGGAVAIRALVEEIPAIKQTVNVPVMGLCKVKYEDSSIYITPTEKEIDLLINAKADLIAMDATLRRRPKDLKLKELVDYARAAAPDVPLVADCDSVESALAAQSLGFEYVSTTLRGYTNETKGIKIPDFTMIKKLRKQLTASKLIVEGGIWEQSQLKKLLKSDPYAVVIGTAITRPTDITKRFVSVWKS